MNYHRFWLKLHHMDQAPLPFQQTTTTKLAALLFFSTSVVIAASSLNIPWVTMRIIFCLYSACFLFFAFRRFQLTFCSVELFEENLVLKYPWKKDNSKIMFSAIRQAHYSRFPFDLVIVSDQGPVRIPRTLQGFQKICDRVFAVVRGEQENTWPITVRVQRPLILSGILFAIITSYMATQLFRAGLSFVGLPLLLLSVASTVIFMDELILRRYYFHQDGLRVKGFFTNRWFPVGTLLGAEVEKGVFWSSIELNFGQRKISIEDRRVDTPIPLIANLVEQGWKCKVTGTPRSGILKQLFYSNSAATKV